MWIISAAYPLNSINIFHYIFANSVSLNIRSIVLADCSINEASSASTNVFYYHRNLCRNVADLLHYKEQLNTLHDTLHPMPSYHLQWIFQKRKLSSSILAHCRTFTFNRNVKTMWRLHSLPAQNKHSCFATSFFPFSVVE